MSRLLFSGAKVYLKIEAKLVSQKSLSECFVLIRRRVRKYGNSCHEYDLGDEWLIVRATRHQRWSLWFRVVRYCAEISFLIHRPTLWSFISTRVSSLSLNKKLRRQPSEDDKFQGYVSQDKLRTDDIPSLLRYACQWLLCPSLEIWPTMIGKRNDKQEDIRGTSSMAQTAHKWQKRKKWQKHSVCNPVETLSAHFDVANHMMKIPTIAISYFFLFLSGHRFVQHNHMTESVLILHSILSLKPSI